MGRGGRTSPPTPADGSSLNIPVRNRPNGSRLNIPVRDRPEDSGLNIPVRNRPNDSRLNIPIRNRRDRLSLHILVRNRRVKARHVLHPQNEILGGGEQVARARLEVWQHEEPDERQEGGLALSQPGQRQVQQQPGGHARQHALVLQQHGQHVARPDQQEGQHVGYDVGPGAILTGRGVERGCGEGGDGGGHAGRDGLDPSAPPPVTQDAGGQAEEDAGDEAREEEEEDVAGQAGPADQDEGAALLRPDLPGELVQTLEDDRGDDDDGGDPGQGQHRHHHGPVQTPLAGRDGGGHGGGEEGGQRHVQATEAGQEQSVQTHHAPHADEVKGEEVEKLEDEVQVTAVGPVPVQRDDDAERLEDGDDDEVGHGHVDDEQVAHVSPQGLAAQHRQQQEDVEDDAHHGVDAAGHRHQRHAQLYGSLDGGVVSQVGQVGQRGVPRHGHRHALLTSLLFTSALFSSPLFTSALFSSPLFSSLLFSSALFSSVLVSSVLFTSVFFGSAFFSSAFFSSAFFTSALFTSVLFSWAFFTSVLFSSVSSVLFC